MRVFERGELMKSLCSFLGKADLVRSVAINNASSLYRPHLMWENLLWSCWRRCSLTKSVTSAESDKPMVIPSQFLFLSILSLVQDHSILSKGMRVCLPRR